MPISADLEEKRQRGRLREAGHTNGVEYQTLAGLRLLDLASGQITTAPGSAGAWLPRWSPDGRYFATLSTGPGGLLVFDFKAQRRSTVPKKGGVNLPAFSVDHNSICFVRFGRDQVCFASAPQGEKNSEWSN